MEDNILNNFFCEISLDFIDINNIFKNHFNSDYGAIVCFFGKVRNKNNEKNVVGISYDMCDEFFIKILNDICYYYCKNYQNIKIYVSHFKGYLKIGFVSTLIIVESLNRKNSFVICSMILEDIKKKLPIWKKEHYFTSNSTWINGQIICKNIL